MKKKILSILGITTIVANATISINGGFVVGLTDDEGTALLSDSNVLVLLVANIGTSGTDIYSGFSDILAGSISTNTNIGADGDDIVIDIRSSEDGGADGAIANAGLNQFPTSFDDSSLLHSLGDDFAVVFFPGLSSTTTELSAGDDFGIIRGSDYTLPSTDGALDTIQSFIGSANVFAQAQFGTVQAIPEPSSTALLGLGGLALLARRRRS